MKLLRTLLSAVLLALTLPALALDVDVAAYGKGELVSQTELEGDLNLLLVDPTVTAVAYTGDLSAQVTGVDEAGNYLLDYTVVLDRKGGWLHLTGVTGDFTPADTAGCKWAESVTAVADTGVIRQGSAFYFVEEGGVSITAYVDYCTGIETYVVTGGLRLS